MTVRMFSAYWTAILIGVLCSAFFFAIIRSEDLSSQDVKIINTTVVHDTPLPDLSDVNDKQKSTIENITPDISIKTDYKVVSSFDAEEKKPESSSNGSDTSKFISTEPTRTPQVTSTEAQHTSTIETKSPDDILPTVKKMGNDSHRYVVRAEPKVVTQALIKESSVIEKEVEVVTKVPTINISSEETRSHRAEEDSTQEDIPSFSEWAEKRLAEAEQNKGENGNASSPGRSGSGARLRSKNYASLDCGAKVVATNPEASSASSLLSPSRDEYLLNACGSKIWFVVELCEAIQAKKIELANFELFSSSPKEFSAFVSDRFPTRDWQSVGQFVATDEKTIQTFDLNPQLFGKFIKIELHSHYGSEHYCPVSLFRAYGTSEFEALETEDHASRTGSALDDDDDDDEDERLDVVRGDAPGNLFGSARDAVLSIVKKAAEALVNKGEANNVTEFVNTTVSQNVSTAVNISKPELCSSPSHIIVCDNCSDSLFDQVFQLLSCKDQYLRNLLYLSFIHEGIKDGDSCEEFGLDFANQRIGAPFPRRPNFSERSRFLGAIFPRSYIAALCNVLAVIERKVVRNITCHNCTANVTGENFPTPPDIQESILDIPAESTCVATESPTSDNESHFINIPATKVDISSSDPKTETLDIKPTKALPSKETHLDSSFSPIPQVDKVVTETSVHHVPTVTAIPTSTTKEIILDTDKNETMGDLSSEESLDKLFSELLDTTTLPTSSATTSPPPGVVQKESVFVRLSNRIKMLERNMSLSGQYLEELSRRYKKQMEEMQRAFNRTLAAITDESKKGEERERLQTAELATLHLKLENLSQIVERLVMERDSWQSRLSSAFQHLLFTAVEVCIFAFLLLMCRRRREDARRDSVPLIPISRRRSVEGAIGHEYVQGRSHQRRPSEEALNILGTYNHLLLKDSVDVEDGAAFKQENKKKKRKKKDSLPKNVCGDQKERRVSEVTATCGCTETVSSQVRSASISDDVFCDNLSVDKLSDEFSRIEILTPTNGVAHSSRSDDKVYITPQEVDIKSHKVTYPPFLKTAISSRNLRRSESCRQPRLKNDNWEWYSSIRSPSIVENGHDTCGVNGTHVNNEVPKKTAIKKPTKKFF